MRLQTKRRLLFYKETVRSTPPDCPEFGCDKLMNLVKTGRGEDIVFVALHTKDKSYFFFCVPTLFFFKF